MEILKASSNSAVILLYGDDCNMIFDPDGSVNKTMARTIASRALDSVGIIQHDPGFSLDAYFGKESCVLFACGEQKGGMTALCRFLTLDDASRCAEALPDDAEASLYHYENRFYLSLSKCTPSESSILSEYGEPVCEPERLLLKIREHGKTISTENTILILRRVG